MYSETVKRKQVAEYSMGGVGWGMMGGGGAIVINAANADLCSTSGKRSHFLKSPPKSLQIPAGLENPIKPL